MVSYENELNRLRSNASEAHTTARHEQLRRKQLEEDLRRMLLKNMTAMNFEALSLFQHTTAPTPFEQQQSMGELKDIISNTADISCIEKEKKMNTQNTPSTSRIINNLFTSNTNISRRLSDHDKLQYQQQQEQQQQQDMEYAEETPRRAPFPTPSTGPTRGIYIHINLYVYLYIYFHFCVYVLS